MNKKYFESKELLEKYDQKHLLVYYNELSEEEKDILLNQILSIDFKMMDKMYKDTKQEIEEKDDLIEPMEYIDKYELEKEEYDKYEKIGIDKIQKGELGVLTMAGGQGTRLRTWRAKRNI